MKKSQAIKFSTLQKEIKSINWCLKYKKVETIEKLKSDWKRKKKELQISEKDDNLIKENESTEGTPFVVTKTLWGHMSPSTRIKAKKRMVNERTEKGINLIRKELGINLSNSFKNETEKAKLQIAIEDFLIKMMFQESVLIQK